mgnify:CR=1 FL=1
MKVIENILMKVSPDRLFSYLMDVDNRKNYIPALEKVIMLDPKPIREGSRYIEVANIAGKRLETTYQVIALETNKRITAQTLKSVFPIQADLTLIDNGAGAKMTIQLNFKLNGVFRLASGVVRSIVSKQAKDI